MIPALRKDSKYSGSSIMANTGASERYLTLRNNKVLVSIRHEADQLSNLTIIDYTKDLLIKSTRSGIPMTRWEANRCFRNNVISVFAKGDIRREIMLQEVTFFPALRATKQVVF